MHVLVFLFYFFFYILHFFFFSFLHFFFFCFLYCFFFYLLQYFSIWRFSFDFCPDSLVHACRNVWMTNALMCAWLNKNCKCMTERTLWPKSLCYYLDQALLYEPAGRERDKGRIVRVHGVRTKAPSWSTKLIVATHRQSLHPAKFLHAWWIKLLIHACPYSASASRWRTCSGTLHANCTCVNMYG